MKPEVSISSQSRHKSLIDRTVYAIMALLSIGLISYGMYRIYPPLAFVVPGALLWIDLVLMGNATTRKPPSK